MNYPIVIHKDKDSDYGVTVPDLSGCFSAGETMEEALNNAKEAILCHIEGLIMAAENIPQPTSIDNHKMNKDFINGIWALVNVDLSEISGKAKRVNITIPENFLHKFDDFAKQHGESRSGLFLNAAVEYISKH